MDDDAERLLTGAAWRDWCDRLKAAGDRILESDFPDDERTRVEGYRALTRLLGHATRLEIEASDPLFPDFVRYGEPHSQWGGSNPDNACLRYRRRFGLAVKIDYQPLWVCVEAQEHGIGEDISDNRFRETVGVRRRQYDAEPDIVVMQQGWNEERACRRTVNRAFEGMLMMQRVRQEVVMKFDGPA